MFPAVLGVKNFSNLIELCEEIIGNVRIETDREDNQFSIL